MIKNIYGAWDELSLNLAGIAIEAIARILKFCMFQVKLFLLLYFSVSKYKALIRLSRYTCWSMPFFFALS